MVKLVRRPKFSLLNLGPLPHDLVAGILNTPMPNGLVHFTAGAQWHSYQRHGEEFLSCHAYLAQTVAAPTYVGQAPHHRLQGFEMVLDVPNGDLRVLMALTLRPCNEGIYNVKSVYPIDENKLARRLRKGVLSRT